MTPSEGFWEGVGEGVSRADGWMLVVALTLIVLVIGALFVYAKYINPSHERLRARELDIREREAENDRDRIKANSALAENMRGLRESNDALKQQSATLAAGIDESKARSRDMGGKVDRIDSTTQHTDQLVAEVHRHLLHDGE